MQTDEQQIFRFNWQVGVIAGVTIVMLIIPLAGVVLCIQHFLQPKPAAVVQQAEPPFRKSLEDIADQRLGGNLTLALDQNIIEFSAENMDVEAARVAATATAYGGFALPAEVKDESAKMTVQIPGNQLGGFSKACLDPAGAPKPSAPDDSRILVEILIKTKKP
ncbi:hypothetical protein BH09VER1_BH09VER1_20680 [soil metagenome]